MTEAFIYDHVRTPRGRGKADGSLHTVTTLQLAATALKAIKDRNQLGEGEIDDVVMGCVDPVGEAGGDGPSGLHKSDLRDRTRSGWFVPGGVRRRPRRWVRFAQKLRPP